MSQTQPEQRDPEEVKNDRIEMDAATGQPTARASDRWQDSDHKEFTEWLIETDLDDGTRDLIVNLTKPDFVLARTTEDKLHELIWELRMIKIHIRNIHPPENGIGGSERKLLYEDLGRNLQPLSPQDRVLLQTAFDAIEKRVTRSLNGFEREKINESVDVRRIENNDRDGSDSGGIFSIFPSL